MVELPGGFRPKQEIFVDESGHAERSVSGGRAGSDPGICTAVRGYFDARRNSAFSAINIGES
jgi:hypothetical protein